MSPVRWIGEPTEIPARPGMFRRSYIGPKDGVRELFLEELTFRQGAAIPLHQHPIVEVFVMLEGSLTFRLGDETLVVGPEHTVTIPPNTPHAVVNVEGRPVEVEQDTLHNASIHVPGDADDLDPLSVGVPRRRSGKRCSWCAAAPPP